MIACARMRRMRVTALLLSEQRPFITVIFLKLFHSQANLSTKHMRTNTQGPMFRKFFQGPNEQQEEEPSSTAQEESQVDLPDISPSELWSRVRACVCVCFCLHNFKEAALAQKEKDVCILMKAKRQASCLYTAISRPRAA